MIPHRPSDSCPIERIADGGLGHVALCSSCGAIHLTVQCMTLRMEPRAFLELVSMVTRARDSVMAIAARAADLAPEEVSRHAPASPPTRDAVGARPATEPAGEADALSAVRFAEVIH